MSTANALIIQRCNVEVKFELQFGKFTQENPVIAG